MTSIKKKKKIQDRYAGYISKLFEDHRKDYNVMKHNFAGLPIMKDEIRAAIRKMKLKLGKATGPDGI